MQEIGSFILDQLLKMQWLSDLVASMLACFGIDPQSSWGGTLHFFIYDTIKIVILLVTMIFVISYIQSYFPPERSRRILSRFRGIQGNVVGALLGTVTPFCSCSSIPLFIGFTRAGLPLGVTFSFLISSPMVDLGSLVLITSAFGPGVAVLYTVFGLVVAIAGGALIQRLGMDDQVMDFVRGETVDAEEDMRRTPRERALYAAGETASTFRKVFPYILVGVGIGSLVHNWIPQEVIEPVLGDGNPFAVILATVAGAPIYADVFGVIPIAESLLAKGAALGTVLSFMMSVTVLSIPSLIMLARVVKPKLLGVFVGICLIGIVACGYAFNVLQPIL